jgi:hypothetical protein
LQKEKSKMTTPYDPNTPNTLYFGPTSSSKEATKLEKTNPTEYKRRKELAIAEGLIARSEHLNPNYRDKFNPRQFTQEELTLLAEVPESETAKFYGSTAQHNAAALLSKMSSEEPERYNSLRRSAQLRGQIETRPSLPTPQPKPTNNFFRLSDELADKANLPHGYMCNADGLATVLKVIEDRRQQKIAADALAAKTAAQLARDKAADESAAEFGRLLDQNREMAAKQREREAGAPTT